MERFLILFIVMFFFAACGTKTVELGNPDFPDNNAAADDDTVVSDSDSDSQIDPDSDSNIPDSDSAIDPDDDTTMPDNDSVIDPDDDTVIDPDDDTVIIPDDDAVVTECTVGERKCDDTLDNVLECNVAHKWISVEDCSAPLKMCVESPADNFFCDDLVCEPGVKLCKNEDLYTCNTDGQGDTLAQNCADTQYCNTISLTCEDMVCDPDQLFCDGNLLKACNGNGSDSTVSKDCGTGTCDDTLNSCLYTSELGGVTVNARTNSLRGNFLNCTKNVTIIEFSQRLNFTGNNNLTWTIYEAEGNSNTYSRVYIKTATVNGTGDSQYSTGAISVALISGKKYIFSVGWSNSTQFYGGGSHPVDLGFGSSSGGIALNNISDAQLINPVSNASVYTQKFTYIF